MIELKAPLSAQVELTFACNNSCFYCYNYWRERISHDPPGHYQPLNVERLEKILAALSRAEVFDVALTGGEPLLQKDLLLTGLRLCRQFKLGVSLNSNLLLLDKTDIPAMYDAGLRGVLTSLASLDEKNCQRIMNHCPGSVPKFLGNVQALLSAGIKVSVNMVVTPLNRHEVFDTGRRLFEEYGVYSFSATPAVPAGYHQERIQEIQLSPAEIIEVARDLIRLSTSYPIICDSLEAMPKCIFPDDIRSQDWIFLQRSCAAGRTTISVSPDGSVRPCSHAEVSYGNLLEEDLPPIWARMKKWRDGSLVPLECEGCAEMQYCNGGCRAGAHSLTGNWRAPDQWMVGKLHRKISFQSMRIPRVVEAEKFYRTATMVRIRQEAEDIYACCPENVRYTSLFNREFVRFLQLLYTEVKFVPFEFAKSHGLELSKLLAVLDYLYFKRFVFLDKEGGSYVTGSK